MAAFLEAFRAIPLAVQIVFIVVAVFTGYALIVITLEEFR